MVQHDSMDRLGTIYSQRRWSSASSCSSWWSVCDVRWAIAGPSRSRLYRACAQLVVVWFRTAGSSSPRLNFLFFFFSRSRASHLITQMVREVHGQPIIPSFISFRHTLTLPSSFRTKNQTNRELVLALPCGQRTEREREKPLYLVIYHAKTWKHTNFTIYRL